jgi:hypothetical protein
MTERILNGARAALLALALAAAAAVMSVAWWAQPALAADGEVAGRFESSLAVSQTGTWGDNLTWSYDDSTKTLTISGAGEMADGSTITTGWEAAGLGSVPFEHVVISEGVTSIGNCAFFGCKSLVSVSIPASVAAIGIYAFYDCWSLVSIFVPEGVTIIAKGAFSGCTSLSSFSVAPGNAAYRTATGREIVYSNGGLAAYAGGSGDSYSIPEGVTSIDDYALADCTSLVSVSIPASVTAIGPLAFVGCASLTSVSIPSSVRIIEYDAFYDCKSLADVYYPGTESDRSGITFGHGNSRLTDATWHYNYVPAQVDDFVERLYENVMGRTADDEGKAVQVAGMKTSGAAQITFNFYNSEEFKAKAATMTNEEIVENVYQTMLDRSSDETGLAMWTKYLDNGMSACALAAGFAESQEFANVCAGYSIGTGSADWLRANLLESRDKVPGVTSFVYRLYTVVLNREAEVDGLNVQCQALIDGTACWDLATRFVNSQEYINFAKTDTDFVADCYKAMMDRKGSESEIAAWVARLAKEGLSRTDVVKGFCQSDEFEKICQSCGMTSGMR